MNNAEKFAEVFGHDLPIRVFCSNDYCPECHKYCLDVFQCSGWAEAEYQEKRAHWIERFNTEEKWLMCENCHGESDDAYKYCPNCGAKMVE